MRISLDGRDWLFKGYYGEDWLWRNAHRPGTREQRGWLPGCVPGSLQHDLWQAGEVPDPYYERNSLLLEWAPQRTWVYKRTFFAGEELLSRRVRLVFAGVDYAARFFLNGEPLGEHRGMFSPAVFEVGDCLLYGQDNLLAVVIEPAPQEQPQVGYTSRVRTHKSRMAYGWDFCPRMIHLGIWDEVYLEATGLARFEDVWVRPKLSEDLCRADVFIDCDLSVAWPAHPPPGFPGEGRVGREFRAFPLEVEVEITLRQAGHVVARQVNPSDITFSGGRLQTRFSLDDPKLWWPNGAGQADLYEAELRVTNPRLPGMLAEDESDARRVVFGIRRIELVPNEGGPDSARPYTLQVNGRRIFAKGWNWVPMDVLYGVERPEKLERLLELARRAQVNLLRVWGGGLIEKESFYDLCDHYGILVWQEFIQSSSGIENLPPDDPEFIHWLVGEAEGIVRRKRNHPSLALWCGGNELNSGPDTPATGTEPLLAALGDAVRRLDPDRSWLPTSPSGPVSGNSLENIARDLDGLHDVHGPWEHQGLAGQCELYNRGTALLHSEFGVEGITNKAALEAVIAKEHQWPVSLDSQLWEHLGAWWVKEPAWRAMFGELPDIDSALRATQRLQAEGLRYAVEADRRREPRCSGTLPWQFDEPYPMAACTSAVDYFARPKPAYYAVARAYEGLHLSARFETYAWGGRQRFEAEIWAAGALAWPGQSCPGPETGIPAGDCVLEAGLVSAGGSVYARRQEMVRLPVDMPVRLLELTCDLVGLQEEVFFLDLRLLTQDGSLMATSRYAFSRTHDLAPLLHAPQTRLAVRMGLAGDEWALELCNTGSQAALFVWLEDARPLAAPGFAFFTDNDFCLLPGESRPVRVDWTGVDRAERVISAGGWNTEQLRITDEAMS